MKILFVDLERYFLGSFSAFAANFSLYSLMGNKTASATTTHVAEQVIVTNLKL